LKTTRILAEIDDETSGTEGFYVSDGSGGLCDTLLCDYESRDTEATSESPLLIEDVTDETKTDRNVVPTATGNTGISVGARFSFYYRSLKYRS